MWVREDGKQAYLGGYSTEEEAAEAHDVAALKCHGLKAKTNFHISRCLLIRFAQRSHTLPLRVFQASSPLLTFAHAS